MSLKTREAMRVTRKRTVVRISAWFFPGVFPAVRAALPVASTPFAVSPVTRHGFAPCRHCPAPFDSPFAVSVSRHFAGDAEKRERPQIGVTRVLARERT